MYKFLHAAVNPLLHTLASTPSSCCVIVNAVMHVTLHDTDKPCSMQSVPGTLHIKSGLHTVCASYAVLMADTIMRCRPDHERL